MHGNSKQIIDNYSPKVEVDSGGYYFTERREGKYPLLFTFSWVNKCFSIYHTSEYSGVTRMGYIRQKPWLRMTLSFCPEALELNKMTCFVLYFFFKTNFLSILQQVNIFQFQKQ